MKLLVDHDLAALNAFLSCVNVGDYVVSGQAESYSCTSSTRRGEAERIFIRSFVSTTRTSVNRRFTDDTDDALKRPRRSFVRSFRVENR